MPQSHFCNEQGMTLTELMIAMVLSLVLMAAVFLANQMLSQSSSEQQQVAALQQDLRAVSDLFAKDIRNAGSSYKQKIVPFANIEQNRITINTDLNNDGDYKDAGEAVTYSLNGSRIERKDVNVVGKDAQVLVDNASNFSLSYLKRDMTVSDTTKPFEIAYVRVVIALTDPRTNLTRTATKTINVRNCYA